MIDRYLTRVPFSREPRFGLSGCASALVRSHSSRELKGWGYQGLLSRSPLPLRSDQRSGFCVMSRSARVNYFFLGRSKIVCHGMGLSWIGLTMMGFLRRLGCFHLSKSDLMPPLGFLRLPDGGIFFEGVEG